MKALKRMEKRLRRVLAGIMIAGGIMAGKEIMEGCGIVIVKEAEASEIVNSSRQIQMIIYTYGNEAYMAEGVLDVLQDGNSGSETVMEIQGSIEKIDDISTVQYIEDNELVKSEPIVLTVYMENKIYGFYSRHELTGGKGMNGDPIIYYGYLEVYSDEDAYYST